MNVKRLLLTACLFVFGAGTASADYLLIKINIDKLNFLPSAPQGNGPNGGQNKGMGGMVGGGKGGFAGGGMMMGGGMGFMGRGPGIMGGMGFMGRGPGIMGGMGFMAGKGPGMVGFMGGIGGFQGKGPGMVGMGGGMMMGGTMMGGTMMGGGTFLGSVQPGQPVTLANLFPLKIKKADPDDHTDDNAKWVYAFVEVKVKGLSRSIGPFGAIMQYDHKWGTGNWLPISPVVPMIGAYLPQESHAKDFDTRLNKAKKDKVKTNEEYLYLVRWALKYGMIAKFHAAMKEAAEVNRKDPTVLDYLRVQKELQGPFKETDPAQAEILEELRASGYKAFVSEQGHYAIHAQSFPADDRSTDGAIKRRLALLETTLETFYYWFAMQGSSAPQPAFPKYRLTAVLANSKEEFRTRHLQWGGVPMVADGFTPRRANILIMAGKSRQTDPRFVEFDTILKKHLTDASEQLNQYFRIVLSPEELLSGKIAEVKTALNAAVYVAAAQTAVLLHKSLEDESERATITNEGIRQLLIASEIFPRNVQIPDWMVEGLAAFFETPMGCAYPTVGTPSWKHLVSFKHLRKTRQFDKAPDVLYNVVTDRYFQDARRLSAEALDFPDDEGLREDTRRAWEMARCSAWSFVYFLAENRELKYLFRYGKELDKLPRDMDLDDLVLQGCFAKAFEMTDPKDARRIESKRLGNMAENWFKKMEGTNLEVLAIQSYLLHERELEDVVENPDAGRPMKMGGDGPNPQGPMADPKQGPQANPAQPQRNPRQPAAGPGGGNRPRPMVRPSVRPPGQRPAGN